jgi:hypothetical protein
MYILLYNKQLEGKNWTAVEEEDEDEVSFHIFTVEFLRCWNHHALLLSFFFLLTFVYTYVSREHSSHRKASLSLSLLFSLHAEVADPRFFFRVYSWRSEGSCKKRTQSLPPPGRRRRSFFFFLSFSIGISDWRWDGGMAKTTQRGATSARNKKKKKKKRHEARCVC